MYYFDNNFNPEKRKAWRNASEVKAAAIEHERQRVQMYQEFSQANARDKQKSGLAATIKAALLFLSAR
ncbi:MAG: hypothetical protein ACM33V_12525 [Chloroflexota bacterium]|nr:hypothetical protein [Anaerolineales bacterium]